MKDSLKANPDISMATMAMDLRIHKATILKAMRMFTGTLLVLQQDGAPAHTSKVVQKKLDGQMTFKPQDFWPPQSPDRDPGQPLTCEQVPHLAERLMGFPWTFS
jgi:hypothetical protein